MATLRNHRLAWSSSSVAIMGKPHDVAISGVVRPSSSINSTSTLTRGWKKHHNTCTHKQAKSFTWCHNAAVQHTCVRPNLVVPSLACVMHGRTVVVVHDMHVGASSDQCCTHLRVAPFRGHRQWRAAGVVSYIHQRRDVFVRHESKAPVVLCLHGIRGCCCHAFTLTSASASTGACVILTRPCEVPCALAEGIPT